MTITADTLRDAAHRARFPLDETRPTVFVVRNCTAEGRFQLDTGTNNCDTVWLFDHTGISRPLRCRSLPHQKYQAQMVAGTARANYIASGYYRHAWMRGPHRGHPALVQHQRFLIWRSADMELHRDDPDPTDDWNDYGIVADNMHGWAPFSAGCVTVVGNMAPPTEDWAIVHRWAYTTHRRASHFAAIILDHPDISTARTAVRYGSQGDEVRHVQHMVSTATGIDIGEIDGNFGYRTHDAVRVYQRSINERDTGILEIYREGER